MPAASPLEARIRLHLAESAARGLTRAMRPPAGIDLSSNDYLNLSTHPEVCAAFVTGISREGCGSTGSRLLRGDRTAFTAVEERFARFKRTDRSLFFSSGYLANLAVLTALSERGDVILSDERNHASIIDGVRLSRAQAVVCPHNDVARVATLLDETPRDVVRFVVIESLYSMDGDRAPLADYARACGEHHAVLIVDEAHAVGVYGDSGSGLVEDAGLDPNACISVNTAGKALGAAGAFVAGPGWAIEHLVQRARPFIFSTAATPALAHALDASLTIVERDRERRRRLNRLAAYVRDRLRAGGFDVAAGDSHIIPIVIGENERTVAIARAIQAEGFDVRAIRPPTVPPGTARLRVSVNAGLSEEVLDRFVGVLTSAMSATGSAIGV